MAFPFQSAESIVGLASATVSYHLARQQRVVTFAVVGPMIGFRDGVAAAGVIGATTRSVVGQQLLMMLASKGVAGVPRAALVSLLGPGASFNLPVDHCRHRRVDGHGPGFCERNWQLPGTGL